MLLFLCFPSMFVQGLRMHRSHDVSAQAKWFGGVCDADSYGTGGHWEDSKTEWGFVFKDDQCGVLPEFSTETFCKEKLQCENLLMVGDSTISEFYFMLWETMNRKTTGVKQQHFDGEGIHIEGPVAEGYSKEEFATECGKPLERGEPNQRSICQEHCGEKKVHMTLIRHDHLNGKKYGAGTRAACAWKQELASHPWVVLHTGTHLNDATDTLMNTDNLWETRSDALFSHLKEVHPNNIIWRTASIGLSAHQMNSDAHSGHMKCPDPQYIRRWPLRESEIGSEHMGSWKKFGAFNKVVTTKLREHLPDAVVLDIEPMMSMRGDCRTDPIHFNWHDQGAGCHMWVRMLQNFMKPLVK